jgi:ABC-type oligopeptide transport system substrate-binding subunit
MKQLKRFFALLLAVAVSISVLPLTALAATSTTAGKLLEHRNHNARPTVPGQRGGGLGQLGVQFDTP